MKAKAILLKKMDNVATALIDIEPDDNIPVKVDDSIINVSIKNQIPFGHKFAVTDISAGDDIIKYGEVIGRATKDIVKGSHAHVSNIESLRGRGDKEI